MMTKSPELRNILNQKMTPNKIFIMATKIITLTTIVLFTMLNFNIY
jgi:hypothetical protein